ncbi:MAG: response regulator [Gemmatimonadetes bacterium]|nr:response regulator [Gemmatimonadota bacterium]NNM05844.1 response regulator [Gemmatimonadota bacterium]
MAKILIVDDDEMDRVLLSEILHRSGHEPLFAPNGQTALKIWRRSKVDIVVTDIIMPELNGLELLETMKEEDPWVRVIAISGITAKKLNEAARSGALAILTKPVDPEELLSEIENALNEPSSSQDSED